MTRTTKKVDLAEVRHQAAMKAVATRRRRLAAQKAADTRRRRATTTSSPSQQTKPKVVKIGEVRQVRRVKGSACYTPSPAEKAVTTRQQREALTDKVARFVKDPELVAVAVGLLERAGVGASDFR